MPAYKVKAAGILGIGSSLPDKILTNFDLEKMVDTSDEWIVKRTGISERRILDNDRPAHILGVQAAQKALKDAGLTAQDIDLIIVTTVTPDYFTPSMACMIQKALGAGRAAAFDMNAACSGFVYGMTVANQFIMSGYYKYILVIGNETMSRTLDWQDRNTCILLGDGAGAAVMGPVEDGYGIISTNIGADGNLGDSITIPCYFVSPADAEKRKGEKKTTIWMDGSEVFKFAVRIVAQATEKALNDSGLTMDEIKLIIPHQANIRIIDGAAKRLNVGMDRIYTNIHKYGNISSASIPVALDEVIKNNLIKKGDNIVLVGFGGGLTWASCVLKWSKEVGVNG